MPSPAHPLSHAPQSNMVGDNGYDPAPFPSDAFPWPGLLFMHMNVSNTWGMAQADVTYLSAGVSTGDLGLGPDM